MGASNRMLESDRSGFVLPATILVLVVVGALITGGVMIGGQETQVATSTEYSSEAFLTAERGLAEAIGGLPTSRYFQIAEGTVWETSAEEESGGVDTRYTLRIRSLGNDLYFVESTGEILGGGQFAGAAHRTGVMVRPVSADFEIRAAIETLGSVTVSGNGFVSGDDHIPTDWDDCPPLDESVPGIVSSDESGTHGAGDVAGNPPIEQDTTLTPESFMVFGDITYDQLAAMADYTLSPGVHNPSPSYNQDGSCDTSDSNNWGHATGACENWFPVVHIQGSGTAQLHGTGQGILLVDGDFVARGGGRFNGIIIVRGQLLVGGGNGGVTGGILVYNDGNPTANYMINGNGIALYSSCAVNQSIQNASALNRIMPIAERSWVDLSGSGAASY
jgi:hypothetical protein